MKENRRKLMVCLRNKCQRCHSSIRMVPECCKFGVLHALDYEQGIQERDRRTGKTTQLIRMANELCTLGYKNVYYVAMNQSMAQRLRESGLLNSVVKVLGFPQLKCGWICEERDLKSGVVFADEIQGEDLEFLEQEMRDSFLVAAYYTPL